MYNAETQIDISDIDASIGLLKDQTKDGDETGIAGVKDFFLETSTDSESNSLSDSSKNYNSKTIHKYSCTHRPVSPALSKRSEPVVEKVEDKRLIFSNTMTDINQLRKRFALSENDISMVGTNQKTLLESFEEELKKKLCKKCLFQSIQSKLSMLGIVSSSNMNITEALEKIDSSHQSSSRGGCENQDKNENDVSDIVDGSLNRSHSTLLENLQKRKVC